MQNDISKKIVSIITENVDLFAPLKKGLLTVSNNIVLQSNGSETVSTSRTGVKKNKYKYLIVAKNKDEEILTDTLNNIIYFLENIRFYDVNLMEERFYITNITETSFKKEDGYTKDGFCVASVSFSVIAETI